MALIFFKNADIIILETPTPLMSSNVSICQPPPPLKSADILCGRSPRGQRAPKWTNVEHVTHGPGRHMAIQPLPSFWPLLPSAGKNLEPL